MSISFKLKSLAPNWNNIENKELLFQQGGLKLYDFIKNNKPVIITGAGISTDSGLPDYRSPNGSYSRGHKPITHTEYMKNIYSRKRYWARSSAGRQIFSAAKPNDSHKIIHELQKLNLIHGLITQNVDGLHRSAGHDETKLIELHGRADRVECMSCHAQFSRKDYEELTLKINDEWIQKNFNQSLNDKQEVDIKLRADLDADITGDFNTFEIPLCPICGKKDSIIKPMFVFFGGNVPKDTTDNATNMINNSNGVLIIGSTVSTWSAFRLCKLATENKKLCGILNLGETRADSISSLNLQLPITPTLQQMYLQI